MSKLSELHLVEIWIKKDNQLETFPFPLTLGELFEKENRDKGLSDYFPDIWYHCLQLVLQGRYTLNESMYNTIQITLDFDETYISPNLNDIYY